MMAERLRRAAVWTGLDQVASTASNSLALFASAHLGGADALTSFSYAFTAYLFGLGVHRALVLDPLLTARDRDVDGAEGTSAVLALAGGLTLGLIGVVVGLLLGRPALVAMSCVMPALLLQDALRYIAFRRRRARAAFLCDLTWCLGLLGIFLVPSDVVTGTTLTLVWGVAGLLAAAVGLAVLGVRPRTSRDRLRQWKEALGPFGIAMVVNSLLFAVGQQLVVLVVVELAHTDSGVGILRAGQSLVGPLPALFAVLNMLVIPRVAQGDDPARLLRVMRLAAFGGCIGWLGLLVLGRDVLMEVAFADAVQVGAALLAVLAGQVLADAFALPAQASLGAARRGRELVTARTLAVLIGAPIAAVYVYVPQVEVLGLSLLTQAAVYAVVLTKFARSRRTEHALAS